MKKIILTLLLVTAMNAQAQESITPSVSVSGEGIVKVVPDQVLIRVRVENEGKSAEEVKTLNDQTIDAVLKTLKKLKIDKKDVRTEYVNLNKNYDYQTKKYTYVANQSLSILIKDLDQYEVVISNLLESGINRIDGIEFKSTEIEKHKAEARKRAVQNAKAKAQEYAEVLGQSVGKAIQISEGSVVMPPQPLYKTMAMMEDAGGRAETIAPGEMSISSSINIIFELK